MQTLLEKIKTLYTDSPGLSPDKIAPTVGQNSGCLLQLHVACLTIVTLNSGEDNAAINDFEVLGPRRAAWYTVYMASILRRLPCSSVRHRRGGS